MTNDSPHISSILDNIILPSDPSRSILERKFHLGLWGSSGSGKTRFIASAGKVPYLSPVLLVDFEGGELTVNSFKYPNISILRVQELPDFLDKKKSYWETSLAVLSSIESSIKDYSKFPYNLIGFDGGKVLQDWCEEQVVKERVAAPSKNSNDETGNKRDPELADLGDFRRVASRMADYFWRVKRLPVHTIFTANKRLLQTEDSTPTNKTYRAGASFFPATLYEFESCWDVLAYMSSGVNGTRDEYLFETRLTSRFVAKSRAQGLVPRIVDPDAEKVFSQLKGGAASKSSLAGLNPSSGKEKTT